jgi:PilZ domain-containing protein
VLQRLGGILRIEGVDTSHFEDVWVKQRAVSTGACPAEMERDLALPGFGSSQTTRRTMTNGRSERRIARTMRVEVCLQDNPELSEKMLTENVSAHGARVLVERKLQPGRRVLVRSPSEGVRSPARIVYCERVSEGRFAVGLELSGRLELWAKPY